MPIKGIQPLEYFTLFMAFTSHEQQNMDFLTNKVYKNPFKDKVKIDLYKIMTIK